MLDNPRVRQRYIRNGDNNVGVAFVIFSTAISHVVYPLPIVLLYESLVLTWIAIIASRIVTLATIQTPCYPPIALDLSRRYNIKLFNKERNIHIFYLFQGLNIFHAVFVFPQTNTVIRVVVQTFVVYKTTYGIKKLLILVAVSHLAYVSTASNPIIPFIKCASLYTFWNMLQMRSIHILYSYYTEL